MVFFEDISVGDNWRTETVTVTLEMIKDFARQYDPQAIHLDEQAGKEGFFGELIGSGWQTAALTMKLIAERRPLGDTPLIGIEVKNFKFLAPLKPGTQLHAEALISKAWKSKSKPHLGFVHFDVTTKTENGQPILTQTWVALVPVRNP